MEMATRKTCLCLNGPPGPGGLAEQSHRLHEPFSCVFSRGESRARVHDYRQSLCYLPISITL